MASSELICVDYKKVSEVWPFVSHFIKRAAERGDLCTFEEIEQLVLDEYALLWIGWEAPYIVGAGVTRIVRTEKSKACVIVAWGGNDRSKWLHLIEKVEAYARSEKCDCVRIMGRKGWQRVLKHYTAPKVLLERRF